MPLTALKLFKNLSDETRLGIVLLLRELGELCVCDFCTALKAVYCWIASRGNGFIIAYPRIFLPGLLR